MSAGKQKVVHETATQAGAHSVGGGEAHIFSLPDRWELPR